MSKLVLYWVPGSGGDIIQGIMSQTGLKSLAHSFEINQQGKVDFEINQSFKSLFPFDGYWYFKDWNHYDIQKLEKLNDVLIGTHRLDQLEFLKSNCSVTTIGITYTKSLFPAVLKNCCKKIASHNHEMREIYHINNPNLFDMFQRNNRLGEFILNQQLKFGSDIPMSVEPVFDINLSLEDIYNKDLSIISKWLSDDSYSMFDQWYNVQDALYKFKFNATSKYVEALGYNFRATTKIINDVPLSLYDKLLLKHYFKNKNLPKVNLNTIFEALEVLK